MAPRLAGRPLCRKRAAPRARDLTLLGTGIERFAGREPDGGLRRDQDVCRREPDPLPQELGDPPLIGARGLEEPPELAQAGVPAVALQFRDSEPVLATARLPIHST